MMAFKIHKMKTQKITITEQTELIKESMSNVNKDLVSKTNIHTIGNGTKEYNTSIRILSNYSVPSGLDTTTYKTWGVSGDWNTQSIKCSMWSTCPHMTIQLIEHANLIGLSVLEVLGLELELGDVIKYDLTGSYGRNNEAKLVIPREDRTDRECSEVLAIAFNAFMNAADELKLGKLTKIEYKPKTQYTTVYS